MTKAEELISKHLDRLNANNIIGKDGNIYKGFLNAINEALTITVVTSTLPNIDSTEFRDWLKSELFEQTLNRFLYKRGGFEYDKDVLYQHYTNQLQFGN